VILAADSEDARSDAVTFDVIHRVRALSSNVPIFAEAVLDENRDRLRRAGANAVVRPSRSYPEMMVRAIVAPGSEAIMENLFSHLGDECVRYDVPVAGVPWARLVSELVARGIGIPLAYHDAENGDITCNPPPDRLIKTDTLFVIVKEGVETPPTRVREILAGLAA
jgi:voltage-gated potassium channel